MPRLDIVLPVAEYVDANPALPVAPKRPTDISGKAIAFIANWKPISTPLMHELARVITEPTGARVAYVGFPGWRFTHPGLVGAIAPEADRLASQVELMVSGVAD